MDKLNSKPRRNRKRTLSQTEDETLQQEARPRRESELSEDRRPLEDESEYFENLRRALESTRSEHDEHADTIRAALNNPELDVNELRDWVDGLPDKTVLHMACSVVIQSHVGAQLLLSDDT